MRNHKLFENLNGAQIKQLCIVAGFKKAFKGGIIYFSGSDLPRIFLLKKGNIKIVGLDLNGNEVIKDIIRKGDLFGEISLMRVDKADKYAKAVLDQVVIYSFLLSDFENLLLQNPNLAISYQNL